MQTTDSTISPKDFFCILHLRLSHIFCFFTLITHFTSCAHFSWIQLCAAPSLLAQCFQSKSGPAHRRGTRQALWRKPEFRWAFARSSHREDLTGLRTLPWGKKCHTGPATFVSDNITELHQHWPLRLKVMEGDFYKCEEVAFSESISSSVGPRLRWLLRLPELGKSNFCFKFGGQKVASETEEDFSQVLDVF